MHPIRKRLQQAGISLVETVAATSVALVGLGAAFALNSAHLRLVESSRQSNAATLSLQERVEQLRLADWRKMTDATYLTNTLLAASPKSAGPMSGISESITVSAYPDPTATNRLIVQRNADGSRTTVSDGDGLGTQRLAQVEFKMKWIGHDQRERTRATTTVISNGGISRMNLPGIGVAGGAPPSGGDTSGGQTGDGGTETNLPPPDPTPPPSNGNGNGNGNGRGNVGGKPGKK